MRRFTRSFEVSLNSIKFKILIIGMRDARGKFQVPKGFRRRSQLLTTS